MKRNTVIFTGIGLAIIAGIVISKKSKTNTEASSKRQELIDRINKFQDLGINSNVNNKNEIIKAFNQMTDAEINDIYSALFEYAATGKFKPDDLTARIEVILEKYPILKLL